MTATVVSHQPAINAFLYSSAGPVVRYVVARAQRVEDRAKQLVGYSEISTSGIHIRDAIHKRFVATERGPAVDVGSSLTGTRAHHQGSPPHIIRPRDRRALAFLWDQAAHTARFRVLGGGYVFFSHVQHPGTRSNPFLVRALSEEFGVGVI